MTLDLEDDRLAVADVDDAGILAGTAEHARPRARQPLQPQPGGFVRAVLAPHDRKDAELDAVRRAAENCHDAREFLGRQPVLGRQFRSDRAGVVDSVHASAPASPAKNALPSVPPSSGSAAFSGCGISPSTVRPSLKMPAIARAEPLMLCASSHRPSGPQ